MKDFLKPLLIIFGLIIFLMLGSLFILSFPVIFSSGNKQMAAGRKYMDSLTDKDFQIWIARTHKYLSEFNPKAGTTIAARPVPPELKQLKILRIDESTNWVSYVWRGGLEKTALHVERMPDENFQFTAIYSDESNRVIWPK